jgi:hypothetical protein
MSQFASDSPAMKVRLTHRVILDQQKHEFSLVIAVPFQPAPNFMFVFRNSGLAQKDYALILEEVYGWDATNQELLARTYDWNVDDWAKNSGADARVLFEESKRQLLAIARCSYRFPRSEVTLRPEPAVRLAGRLSG